MYIKGLPPQPEFLIASTKLEIKKFPTQEKSELGIVIGILELLLEFF